MHGITFPYRHDMLYKRTRFIRNSASKSSTKTMKIVVCGYGAGAIALAALNANKDDLTVILYKRKAAEMPIEGQAIICDGRKINFSSLTVSTDPTVFRNADAIFLCHPLPSYPEFLKSHILPNVSERLKILCAVPGACAFDWMVQEALPKKTSVNYTVCATESLPFISRIDKIQVPPSCVVLGFKAVLKIATAQFGATLKEEQKRLMEAFFGNVRLQHLPSFVSLTLLNPTARYHPVLIYNYMKHCSNTLQIPDNVDFYEIDEESRAMVEQMDAEVADIAMKAEMQGIPIGHVDSVTEWLATCYPHSTKDTSSVSSCLATNIYYSKLGPPTYKKNGITYLNVFHRYLSEELPLGLMSLYGLGELFSVKTPAIYQMISWGQDLLGEEYIDNGNINTSATTVSGAPQKFGYKVISQLAKDYRPQSLQLNLELSEYQEHGITYLGNVFGSYENIQEIQGKETEDKADFNLEELAKSDKFLEIAAVLLNVEKYSLTAYQLCTPEANSHKDSDTAHQSLLVIILALTDLENLRISRKFRNYLANVEDNSKEDEVHSCKLLQGQSVVYNGITHYCFLPVDENIHEKFIQFSYTI